MSTLAVVTGANGYLGSRIVAALGEGGWSVVRFERTPGPGESESVAYDLGRELRDDHMAVLAKTDVVVHAAYDFSVSRPRDIWRVNVAGTQRLMSASRSAGVRRTIVLSSMSAYDETTQWYGLAKLAIEDVTLAAGGVAVRPGLVIGDDPGGMAGALARLARLPVSVTIAGDPTQFVIGVEDLMAAIVGLAGSDVAVATPVGVAYEEPVPLRELLRRLGPPGKRQFLVPVPWQVVYAGLRLGEAVGLRLPFRSDSLLGLVRPAPAVPGLDVLEKVGVRLGPLAT